MRRSTTGRFWFALLPFLLLALAYRAWPGGVASAVPSSGLRPLAPATAGPSPSPTTMTTATPTPIVSGGIELSAPINQGCAPIPVTVRFTATSRVEVVDAMRVVPPFEGDCGGIENQIRDKEWEPYQASKVYEADGGPHYFWLSAGVQYRDRRGNLSPVYCRTISGVCMGTETPLPTLDATPHGGPIPVGTPLAPPPPAVNAIAPDNAGRLVDVGRLDPGGPEGSRIVGYTMDGVRVILTAPAGIRVLRTVDGQVVASLPVWAEAAKPEILSPDGTLLVVAYHGGAGNVNLWDLWGGRLLRQHIGGEPVSDRVFLAGGRSLAVGRSDGSFQLYDVATGTLIANDRGVSAWDSVDVAAHPRAALVAVGSGDGGIVTERDALTGEVLRTRDTGVEGTVRDVLYRADGALTVVVQGPRDFSDPIMEMSQPHSVVVLAEDGRRAVLRTVHKQFTYETTWSPTGQWLALGHSAGFMADQRLEVLLWDGVGATRSLVREPGLDIAGLAWSPDGRVLAVGMHTYYSRDGKEPGQVRLYDADSGLELARLPDLIEPVIAPDGGSLVAAGDGVLDAGLHVFTVTNGTQPTVSPPRRHIYLPLLQ